MFFFHKKNKNKKTDESRVWKYTENNHSMITIQFIIDSVDAQPQPVINNKLITTFLI